MSGFNEARKFTHSWEKGYSDHPDDPGGATKDGIIQRTYDKYRDEWTLSRRPVRQITDDEIERIYKDFWNKSKAPLLPTPLDIVHFDTCFNMGFGSPRNENTMGGAEILQLAVGSSPDGVIGPNTLAAVHRMISRVGIARVIQRYLTQRALYYASRNHFPTFGKGWYRRLFDLGMLVGKLL
jgi:lysozyme family protein